MDSSFSEVFSGDILADKDPTQPSRPSTPASGTLGSQPATGRQPHTTRKDQLQLQLQLHLVAIEVAIEVAVGQLQLVAVTVGPVAVGRSCSWSSCR